MVAPRALPSSYSWIDHTTSESAAQGVDGAWVGRLGFLLFGFAVLWIAQSAADRWGPVASVLHVTFGVCMAAVAAFSARSWVPDTPFDSTEDALHSVAATVMGFAFAFGVIAVSVHRLRNNGSWRLVDVGAAAAATILPILMTQFPEHDGLLQRLMFLIAFIWYGFEAHRSRQN